MAEYIEAEVKKKLIQSSFQSLTAKGIDWKTVVKTNPAVLKRFNEYLTLKQQSIMVEMDYSQLELYVLASVSGDKNMIATVNSGLDLHSENTKKIYGIDYARYETELKSLKEGTDKYNEVSYILKDFKAKRKSVKALSFSLTYGAGAEKISMDQKISIEDSRQLISDFYNIYPDVKTWQNGTFLGAVQRGYIETPFGRRRATPKVHGRLDAYRALAEEQSKYISQLKRDGEYWSLREEAKTCKNTPIQSVASDMCSMAACKFKEWLKTAGKRAEMMFWVHDSILFSVHIDDAVEVIEGCRDIMENKVKYDRDPVNYRTSIGVGYNYEFMSEIARDSWISTEDKIGLVKTKLVDALDSDLEKKLKLVIKSSSMTMDKDYLKNIMKSKEDYFEKLISKLEIDGVNTPHEYMAWQNNMSVAEYEESVDMSLEDEDD